MVRLVGMLVVALLIALALLFSGGCATQPLTAEQRQIQMDRQRTLHEALMWQQLLYGGRKGY